MMLNPAEIQKNKRAFDHAIAQQKLEGLTVPKHIVEEMQRMVQGEISSSDIIQNIHSKFPHVKP